MADICFKNSKVRAHVAILTLYFALLPISTALSGLLGSVSVINYVAVAYVATAVLVGKVRFLIKRDNSALSLYFLYIMLSLFWNSRLKFNWYVSTTLLSIIVALTALGDDYSDGEVFELKRGIIASFIICVFITIVNIGTLKGSRLSISLTSNMDINDFACGFVIIVALLLSTLFKDKKVNITAFLSLVVCAGIIVFSGSRGAMLMAVTMVIAWVILEALDKKFLPIIVFGILCALLLSSYWFLPDFVQSRLNIVTLIKDGGSGRSRIWRAAFERFGEGNIVKRVYGYGYGSFKNAVHYIAPGHTEAYESHNIFINMLIEGGAVGLSLLLFAFAKTFLQSYENKNYCGMLAVVGLAVAGISLDMQATRVFTAVFIIAIVFNRQALRSGLPLKSVICENSYE